MPEGLREEILLRVLVSKQLLASNMGQLRPASDALAVAKMILTAHDAAEVAAGAIADHIGVTDLQTKTYLMEYPSKIVAACPQAGPFPGLDYLRQLNDVRVYFKHRGILPDPRSWYQVIERTWDWIDTWCKTYLGVSIDEISLEQMLADATVRDFYQNAKVEYERRDFKAALEWLGRALYLVLARFPGIRIPVLGVKSPDSALKLAAFGVRPSDFLNLQEFVPSISKDSNTGELNVKWELRETGNPANWTEPNVRFCLDTFLDTALKIQHAPWSPTPVHYTWVFDDMISPSGDSAELFQYEYGGFGGLAMGLGFGTPTGKKVVKILERGERLRCLLSPGEDREKGERPIFQAAKTIEAAEILDVFSDQIAGGFAHVRREDIEVSFAPKDTDFVRTYFPHLLKEGSSSLS